MKNEFFEGLFETASKFANETLDKAEAFLRDVEKDLAEDVDAQLEELRFTADRLEAENDNLRTEVDDLKSALQVLLDGQLEKDVRLTWEKYNNLCAARLEVFITDDPSDNINVHFRQSMNKFNDKRR